MEVAQLVIEVVMTLLLLHLAFFKSYFGQKGKNLATKEDVEEITLKVESVRSGILFSLEGKSSWRREEHDSIVEYFEKLSTFVSEINNVSFSEVTDENMDRLKEIRSRLNELQLKAEAAYSRVELFVENDEIERQKGEIMLRLIDFHQHAVNASFEFEGICLEIKHIRLTVEHDEQVDRIQEVLDRRADMYRQFKESQQELFRDLLPLVAEHRRTLSRHLRNLIQDEG